MKKFSNCMYLWNSDSVFPLLLGKQDEPKQDEPQSSSSSDECILLENPGIETNK